MQKNQNLQPELNRIQKKYEGRTLEHDKIIKENWNRVVHNNDNVYILGDFGKEGGNKDNEYLKLYGPHGFDDMDDYIVEQILGEKLGTEAADKISSTAYSCAQRAISMIRKENIEFGSVKAFYVLSRTVKVMYRIGAALQLKRLGYKFEKLGN